MSRLFTDVGPAPSPPQVVGADVRAPGSLPRSAARVQPAAVAAARRAAGRRSSGRGASGQESPWQALCAVPAALPRAQFQHGGGRAPGPRLCNASSATGGQWCARSGRTVCPESGHGAAAGNTARRWSRLMPVGARASSVLLPADTLVHGRSQLRFRPGRKLRKTNVWAASRAVRYSGLGPGEGSGCNKRVVEGCAGPRPARARYYGCPLWSSMSEVPSVNVTASKPRLAHSSQFVDLELRPVTARAGVGQGFGAPRKVFTSSCRASGRSRRPATRAPRAVAAAQRRRSDSWSVPRRRATSRWPHAPAAPWVRA